jgi:ribosome-associated protein
MAKKIVKKVSKKAVKKSAKKTAASKKTKKTAAPKKKSKLPAKKGGKAPVKPKKTVSEKDRQQREANVIANSEKKRSARPSIGKGKREKKNITSEQTSSLLDAIVNGMQEKKARNITVLNLSDLENRVSDFFVICDAESRTQVEAIAESIKDTVESKTNEKPYHAEGFENAEWILIDYINIVAHVFQKETRDYYNVEGLWADAEIEMINN